MPRAAGSRLIVVACVVLLLGACGGGGGSVTRTAAQRFDDAVALIAKAFGKSTGEVRAGFETKLPAATIDDLAIQAERTAVRAADLERIAAQRAQDARRQAMMETLYGATCDYIEIADELAATPSEDRWPRFEAILVEKLAEHQLDTGSASVTALSEDVADLLNILTSNSTRPVADVAVDLACFPS